MRTVTLAAGIGTIDTAGQTVTFNNAIGNSGAGGLTKTGLGTLTLNGTNKYSGVTTVNQGTPGIGHQRGVYQFGFDQPGDHGQQGRHSVDTATSEVQGLSLVSQVHRRGVGTVKGEVAALAGSLITHTNGVIGTLSFANDLGINGATVAMDVSASESDLIAVAGNLGLTNGILQLNVTGTLANGRYKLISYGGSLLSGAGSSANLTVVGFSSANQLATLSDSTAGEIDLGHRHGRPRSAGLGWRRQHVGLRRFAELVGRLKSLGLYQWRFGDL